MGNGNLKDTHFYQLQVRQYPAGTPIKSFFPEDIAEYSEIIDKVTLALSDPKAVQDLPFLAAVGKGMYVGSVSFILNPNTLPTPWGNWWGEGVCG